MNAFIRLSSFKIILTFVCLAIVGLTFIPILSIKLSPSQTLPQLNISFSMPGISPIVVETEVTSRLESMLSRIEGINKITSSSGNGGGNITLYLEKHVNIEQARFEVSTIIRQAWSQLPHGVSYPYISSYYSDDNFKTTFLNYTVVASDIPLHIQEFVHKYIKPNLAQIEGVYEIEVSEANPMEWQLEYDYNQLAFLDISIYDIHSAVEHYLDNESLGVVNISNMSGNEKQMGVVLLPLSYSAKIDEIYDIEIGWLDNRIITLRDIVTIKRVESQPNGYYRINGMNTIYFSIKAHKNANQLDLAKVIKKRLVELEKNFPEGYSVQLEYDATEYLQKELNKIYFRCGLTLVILLLFVLLIYRSIKYTLLICSSLFINIAIAFIFYYLFKLEIQIYSLAGITISLTLIIDNSIVMSDQIIVRRNKKSFLAILAATLTTIGSLIMIFFLEERIRMNLQDFAVVIIINLFVSLMVALFLVPALIEKMNITGRNNKSVSNKYSFMKRILSDYHKKKILIYFNKLYSGLFRILWRWRVIVVFILVLAFGLPVFLIPDKIDGDSRAAILYKETLGSNTYKEKIAPYVNAIFGGTWRLFVEKVYTKSYLSNQKEETRLVVAATLPYGATVEQMNHLIMRMEEYIKQFSEIKQFETNIQSANRASIEIRFKDSYQKGNFPHSFRSKIIRKSLEISGGSWEINGVGDGFSNDVKQEAGSFMVEMLGYNYDELADLAEDFKEKLMEQRRIKEVIIASEFSWYKDEYQEFRFNLKKEKVSQQKIQPYELYSSIKPFFEKRVDIGDFFYENRKENLILYSGQSTRYSIWDLENIPVQIRENSLKLSELATIEKHQSPQKIIKENQQYRLCVQFEYVGAKGQGERILDRYIEETQNELPLGYSIKKIQHSWGWGKEDNSQYWLLGIVFLIIYFCSSILFNSLRQPFYIIFIIPVSFIGLFLTFYLFKLNFDQGGFAAFILLSGLTVNANIYIINEYNNIRKQRPNLSPQQAYLKAWNAKVRPIFLTIVSTILGFIPFMIGDKEGFWFPLAAGTIGGLIVSFIATFCILPLLMGKEVCRKEIK